MAGSRSIITLLAVIAAGLLLAPVAAQEIETGDASSRPESPRRLFPRLGNDVGTERDRLIREIQKLSPEQRRELWRVVWAVLRMPMDKRRAILGFDEERRKKAMEEITAAIEESGAPLDDARKKEFMQRYFEGRKAIEQRVRMDGDEKRHQLVRELRARLRKEFAPHGSAASPGTGTR